MIAFIGAVWRFFKPFYKKIDRDNIFFVDRIEPSDSFTVGENGITFYYQPYDVAPYVFGVIEITVPWEELR